MVLPSREIKSAEIHASLALVKRSLHVELSILLIKQPTKHGFSGNTYKYIQWMPWWGNQEVEDRCSQKAFPSHGEHYATSIGNSFSLLQYPSFPADVQLTPSPLNSGEILGTAAPHPQPRDPHIFKVHYGVTSQPLLHFSSASNTGN